MAFELEKISKTQGQERRHSPEHSDEILVPMGTDVGQGTGNSSWRTSQQDMTARKRGTPTPFISIFQSEADGGRT